LSYPEFEQKCSAASYCGMESSQMPNAHSYHISIKNNFRALNTLFNSAVYTIKSDKSIFVSMPKNLAWTQQQVDSL
jgi:hypothetical protein